MLTRDLLRFRTEGDRLVPRLLKPTPLVLELCRNLLAHWRGAIGGRIGEVEDAAQAILHGSRQLVVARGLQKIIVDACSLEAPTTAEPLRARAFAIAADRLRQPLADAEAHRIAIAAELGLDPAALSDALYADHPDRAVLAQVPAWDEATLVARYHLELIQGLLLGAQHLDARVLDPERGVHRRLMQAVRWRRLLAEATQHEGHLRLQISGPAAVLDQKTAYGMQFALFLPALCAARRWHAVAQVVPPRGHLALRLELSDELHLPGMAQSAEHVPAELTAWMRQVAAKLTAWRPVEPEPILIPGGEVVFPDWAALPEPGEVGRVSVELFHRWHRNALERRLRQVRAGQLPRFLVGVDRSLAKQDGIEAQLDHPAVFRFSELPTPGILAKALAALA